MKRLPVTSLLLLALTVPAWAQTSVTLPWVRATVPAQTSTGAFMQITAPTDSRLVEVRTPVAGVAEIHEMRMVDNVMKMRPAGPVDLPAGKAVELKPGGYHVMLMELKGQIKAGDTVPLTLVVEGKDKKRETIEVKAVARALGEAPPTAHQH